MHREIAEGVYYVGVDDHHTQLFENLWALPHGVSYNSYLIVDEKIAVIETVKGPWAKEWIDNIREIIDPAKIDYVIMNHMEPDHTGSLPDIAAIAKNATMIYSPKAAAMQKSFYDVRLKEKIADDLEELSLGKRTLKFIHAQFLHWPETMFTYLVENQILFPCDAFGSFGALTGKHFDDEIDLRMVESESKRYLSAIITSYFKFVQLAIAKVKQLGIPIKVIAPSHGPVYRKDPMWIVSRYQKWTLPELERYCTIVYGTMYGYNHRLAMKLKKELMKLDVEVRTHNVSYSEMSRVLTDAVHAGVLVLGTPTYDAFPFPKIWAFVNEIEGKRFAKRPVGFFGTFGWGGGGVKKLHKTLSEDLKFDVIEPVIDVRARPSADEEESIRKLAAAIASRLKTGNFRG